MKTKTKWTLAAIFCALFLLLIVGIKTIDVAAIGPKGTEIGFSAFNAAVHSAFGVNILWYKVTDLLGYAAIAVTVIFWLMGLTQWIRRKNLFSVDPEILLLGGLLLLIFLIYVFFQLVVVTYRPELMPGSTEVEAAFPSSHTMLACVLFSSTIFMLNIYLKNLSHRRVLKIFCVIAVAVAIIGRLLSGVHWFTDILGAVLLSASLLFAFAAGWDMIHKAK